DLLDHHLLGGLGTNSAHGFLGIEDFAINAGGNRPVLAVDLYLDVGFFAIVLLGGGDEGCLNPFKNYFLVDVLVAVNGIDDSQDLLGIHGSSPSAADSPTARGNSSCRIVSIALTRL